jgi:hypothetical protein
VLEHKVDTNVDAKVELQTLEVPVREELARALVKVPARMYVANAT